MRTNKNTYTPDLYISPPNETLCETPTEIIIRHIYKAYKNQDKKQADFLINLVLEMQIFWIDYDYENPYCPNLYLETYSDAHFLLKLLVSYLMILTTLKSYFLS